MTPERRHEIENLTEQEQKYVLDMRNQGISVIVEHAVTREELLELYGEQLGPYYWRV